MANGMPKHELARGKTPIMGILQQAFSLQHTAVTWLSNSHCNAMQCKCG